MFPKLISRTEALHESQDNRPLTYAIRFFLDKDLFSSGSSSIDLHSILVSPDGLHQKTRAAARIAYERVHKIIEDNFDNFKYRLRTNMLNTQILPIQPNARVKNSRKRHRTFFPRIYGSICICSDTCTVGREVDIRRKPEK